jgi:hypothetical protein
VSQISQPVRIILIGAVVFLAAWFTLLRPKGEPTVPPLTTTNTTAPPVSTPQTGLGRAVESAKKVAGQSDAKTAEPAATPATGTKPTTSAPDVKAQPAAIAAVPAEALAKLPKDVAGALKARKVLVLGVLSEDAKPWRPLADDDRYVRNSLEHVNRYDGSVVVKRIALDKLSTYGSLVNDLDVSQSPSIVVIDRDLKGSVLTGYVDTVSINQAIADARRNSMQPNISDDYLHQANQLCGRYETRTQRWSFPTIRGQKALTVAYKRGLAITRQYRREIARTPAPAKWKSLKKQWLKAMDNDVKRIAALVKASKTRTTKDDFATDKLTDGKTWRKLDKRFDDNGVTDCAETRRS